MKTQIEVRDNGMVFVNGKYVPGVVSVACEWDKTPTVLLRIANYELIGKHELYEEMGIL